jgi:metallopeptidase family M12-like protein
LFKATLFPSTGYGTSPVAWKLPLYQWNPKSNRRKSPNFQRNRESPILKSVLGFIGLAWALPLCAVSIPSPLRDVARSGPSIQRATPAGERLLDLDPRGLERLRSVSAKESVTLQDFPFAPGATANLVLERFDVVSPDGRLLIQRPDGETSLPLPRGTHFEGHIEGEPDSRVYVGVPGSFLVAILQTSAGLVYVGPDGPFEGPVQHVVRRSDSPRNAELAPLEWHCDSDELSPAPLGRGSDAVPQPGLLGALSKPSATTFSALATSALKNAEVSIETDQELLSKFSGNTTSMTTYVTTLLAQMSVIYERDVSVHLTVNLVQAWTTTDPYSRTDPRGQLDEVGDWWHANRPKASYPRTIVQYLSGKSVTGGIAWLGVLCANDFSQNNHWGGGYGVVQINGNYPSNLWDLVGASHEMGHNFGSSHTHCFSPPIDMCYAAEGGCYSGSVVNPGPLGGTIMSYCHLLSGGLGNIDLRFHQRCITEQMLPEINSVACLTTLPDVPAVATLFYTLTPCRAVDTRNPTGQYGGPAFSANTERTFPMGGRCGIPATAKAVSLNVTVTQSTAPGFLRLYPGGTALPLASAINYRAGQTRANNQYASLGSTGGMAVRCDQTSGNVQVIIDVNGYFQ